MAGRSQHRDNRSSYFSSDIGRSGVYDGVNGTPINFSQRGDNPNDLRDTEGISETARESGLYASRIGSTKQLTEDYSKEGMLGSTGNFPRQNWDQSFEEGNRTPESGTYSRNIESNQYDTDYKANNDIGRSSTFDNNRDSGLYSRKIGSFRETIPENSGKDNQRQSSKHFKPNKYIGNTLDTMLEGEDESKQPEHFHSTNYSESRKYSGTARNGDYDGHSNASFQDDKEFPPWAGMMVEQQFTDKYIKTKWPRISLHLTQPRHSDPFVPGKIDEGSIDINSAKDDHKTRNTLCVIGLGTLLLCLVGAAIITVIVLANQSSDKTEYVKVNMTVTVEQAFTSELNDSKSTDYKTFATEVCKQTKDVYTSANSTLSGYYGCKVSNLENGSIIVTYIIYFTGTTTQQVTPEAVKTILDTHLNVSSSKLGDLVIKTDSVIVYNVETETLSSPPPVEVLVTTTTTVITTPLIETTTEVVVSSTVTTLDSETVHTTEATTLNTKQTTTETNSLTTSSTEATTPKTVQTTTETAISTGPPTEDTTTEAKKSTMKTTTSTTPPTEDTTTEPKQATLETTTSTAPPTEDTTTEPNQATMETTTSTAPPTEDTTTETVESTTEPTSPLISSTEGTTPKTVQSFGETSTPSVSLTDETTPKTMHSTTKIITASSSSTENTTPKTMQTETTSPIIDSTVEPMSRQSTNHVSEVTTTLSTDMTTEATQETTSGKTSPTQDSISSTTQDEPTTMTSTITTSSTKLLSDTTTPDSTERTTTSSSVPLIDTTQPTISTSTDDTNQLITSPPTEDTTKLITSTSTEETTNKMPSTSTDYTTHAEDTTKPTTSASTEESTTKLIPLTSTDDTTKPVTFTSTDDSTATVASTATVDTTKSVTSTPTEVTTKTISSAPTEDTTPSVTTISTEDTTKLVPSTPTEDTTTKTVSSIPTEGTTMSITVTSTSMPTAGRTTSDEITTVSGTTTESQNIGLNCTDSLNGVLYSGQVAIFCTIQKSDNFDYIEISHGDGANNSIYGVLLNKDGNTIQNYVENQSINVTINSTSTLNLALTFVNVSCTMDGFYKVALIGNMSGEMKVSVSRNIQLEVSSPAEKPILTLNADQVIDLIFNNDTNDYYRTDGMHQCEGYVGHPPSNLEIDITYNNGSSFEMISNENIHSVITKMSNGCRNKELIKFGLRFTRDMIGAKLRCGVKDSTNDFMLSEELSLIQRNICSCAVSESYRAHPNNCKVRVYCLESDGIMYPTGSSCPVNECYTNSITGECTTNCSNAVCERTVPSDLCTTPAPPTTTPIPSAYIGCNDSTAPLHSGPVDISCILNETTFTMINVTFKSSATSNLVVKATINNNRNVTYMIPDDNFSIRFETDVLTISIKNATCMADGTYGISVDFNNVVKEEANGKLTISSNPGKPLINMHTDQIVDLGYYRTDRLHTCSGDVGVPSKQLIIELVYANGSEFQITGDNIESRDLESANCQNSETVKFGISFTSEMNGGKVRCRVDGSDANSTKSDIDLALIPRNICSCGNHLDSIGHPQSCYAYVSCSEIEGTVYPFGISCPLEQCRNSITGVCSSNCSQTVCSETVPSGFCTTPPPMLPTVEPSRYIQCYGNSTFQFSGEVQIVCVLNQTEFSSINVTFQTTEQSNLIAQIASDRNVHMIDTSGKIDVRISSKTVTVELLNASCIDSGLYVVAVDLEGDRATAQGELSILTKPEKPILQVPFHTVENQRTTITCTGNTGSPAGSLQILIKRQNVSDPVTFNISSDSVKVIDKSEICNHEETVTLEETLTSDWNLTTIQCKAVNQETITEEDESISYTSDESQIVLIEANYCPAMSAKEEYKYHPKSCNHYVLCSGSRMFQLPCPTTLCFSFNSTYPCASCDDAPAPCSGP